MSESLHLTRNGSILEITLDRPKANAIDAKTSFEMGEVFLNFRDDPQLRVAIITGAGEKFFSAGWALNWHWRQILLSVPITPASLCRKPNWASFLTAAACCVCRRSCRLPSSMKW